MHITGDYYGHFTQVAEREWLTDMITPKYQAGDYVWIRDRHGKARKRRIWRVSYVWDQVSPRDGTESLIIETLFYSVSAKSPWATVDLGEESLFATKEEAENS